MGVRVSDGRGGQDVQWFTLDVAAADVNTAPRITSEIDDYIFLNEPFGYQITAEDLEDDNDGDPSTSPTFALDQASLDLGMSIDAFTGLLAWTPTVRGTFTARVTVTDSDGASSGQLLTLPVNVKPVENQPARFTTSPTGPAVADRSWTYTARATDADGEDVTIELIEAPAWLDQAAGATGTNALTLTGTPPDGGEYRIVLRATDPQGEGAEQTFDLPVIANAPPIIVRAVQRAGGEVGTAGTYEVEAFDPNGDALTFELVEGAETPGSGSFGPVTNGTDGGKKSTLTFTPDVDGTREVRVRVSDGTDTAEHVMTLVITDPNQQPPRGEPAGAGLRLHRRGVRRAGRGERPQRRRHPQLRLRRRPGPHVHNGSTGPTARPA